MSERVGARIFAFELGAMGALLLSAALLRRYGGRLGAALAKDLGGQLTVHSRQGTTEA
jgi:hypothetical protein